MTEEERRLLFERLTEPGWNIRRPGGISRLHVQEMVIAKKDREKGGPRFDLMEGTYGGQRVAFGLRELEAKTIARLVNLVRDLEEPERFLTDVGDMAFGRATSEQIARVKASLCSDCGALFGPKARAVDSRASKPGESRCSTCIFWGDLLERRNPRMLIVQHGQERRHYTIGEPQHVEPPDTDDSFLGFGGAKHVIAFDDGRVEVTHNLWCQGTIPRRLHARPEWKPNATFERFGVDESTYDFFAGEESF